MDETVQVVHDTLFRQLVLSLCSYKTQNPQRRQVPRRASPHGHPWIEQLSTYAAFRKLIVTWVLAKFQKRVMYLSTDIRDSTKTLKTVQLHTQNTQTNRYSCWR